MQVNEEPIKTQEDRNSLFKSEKTYNYEGGRRRHTQSTLQPLESNSETGGSPGGMRGEGKQSLLCKTTGLLLDGWVPATDKVRHHLRQTFYIL